MDTINEILDSAKNKIGKESDRQLALHLGVTPMAVSYWRQGKNAPDAYALMELQKILRMDAREILAIIEAERAKTLDRKEYWEGVKKSFSTQGIAALAIALAMVGATAYPSKAYANSNAATSKLTGTVYIM